MRIHTDVLTPDHFSLAASRARVRIVSVTEHGSRSRRRAYDFYLSGSGVTGGQWGSASHKTATWDEWGIFLNVLFDVDPTAVIPRVYDSAEHFHWATGDRYTALTPNFQHLRHRWNPQGFSITGTYATAECDCGAHRRWMMPGHTFAELATV